MVVFLAVLQCQGFEVYPAPTTIRIVTNITDCHFGKDESIMQRIWFTYEQTTCTSLLTHMKLEENISAFSLACSDFGPGCLNCEEIIKKMSTENFLIFSNVTNYQRFDLALKQLNVPARRPDIDDSIVILMVALIAFFILAGILLAWLCYSYRRDAKQDEKLIEQETEQFKQRYQQVAR